MNNWHRVGSTAEQLTFQKLPASQKPTRSGSSLAIRLHLGCFSSQSRFYAASRHDPVNHYLQPARLRKLSSLLIPRSVALMAAQKSKSDEGKAASPAADKVGSTVFSLRVMALYVYNSSRIIHSIGSTIWAWPLVATAAPLLLRRLPLHPPHASDRASSHGPPRRRTPAPPRNPQSRRARPSSSSRPSGKP